ncbi:hypothetical protein BURKHO8Y_510031 [Burkholderia sp. 8Y]|nr:hypothetical protein BURKHO8Y_510031 [Burkholderia sp. 8Y]
MTGAARPPDVASALTLTWLNGTTALSLGGKRAGASTVTVTGIASRPFAASFPSGFS